jgi:hypothetical protein
MPCCHASAFSLGRNNQLSEDTCSVKIHVIRIDTFQLTAKATLNPFAAHTPADGVCSDPAKMRIHRLSVLVFLL